MNGLPRAIALQDETARPPWIIRVIFNQYGLRQSLDDITYPDLVLGELFVACTEICTSRRLPSARMCSRVPLSMIPGYHEYIEL